MGLVAIFGTIFTSFSPDLFAGLIKNSQSLLGGRHLLRRQLDVGEGWDQPLQLFAQRIRQADAAAQHVAKSQLAFQVQCVLLVVLLTCAWYRFQTGWVSSLEPCLGPLWDKHSLPCFGCPKTVYWFNDIQTNQPIKFHAIMNQLSMPARVISLQRATWCTTGTPSFGSAT